MGISQHSKMQIIEETQEKSKVYYDKTEYEGIEYDIEDIVVIKTIATLRKNQTKILLIYRGPLLKA